MGFPKTLFLPNRLDNFFFSFFFLVFFSSNNPHLFSLPSVKMPICHEESFGSRMVKTLLIVPLFLYALLNKLAALILGLFLVIISLIPIPRLGQWCPAFIALFDGLLAITVGLILYVLILWAFAGEPSDDEKNDNFGAEFNVQNNENKEEEEIVSATKETDGEG